MTELIKNVIYLINNDVTYLIKNDVTYLIKNDVTKLIKNDVTSLIMNDVPSLASDFLPWHKRLGHTGIVDHNLSELSIPQMYQYHHLSAYLCSSLYVIYINA